MLPLDRGAATVAHHLRSGQPLAALGYDRPPGQPDTSKNTVWATVTAAALAGLRV